MMGKGLWRNRFELIAGATALIGTAAAAVLMPQSWRDILRESAFDNVLTLDGRLRPAGANQTAPNIVVVDIDRPSLERLGPWPWSRTAIARLVATVAAARPRVIAIDILFADADTRSAGALARELGRLVDRADIATMAESLPDGDRLLADAMHRAAVVLGFVLDPTAGGAVVGVPVLVRGYPHRAGIWSARGAIGPTPVLAGAAAGMGALSLPGDADGIVRRVPLLVDIGGDIRPGLAFDALRAAQGASAYVMQPESGVVRTGVLQVELGQHALLRLLPIPPEAHAGRTFSAADLLKGKAPSAFTDAIVLIGSSAPEAGGLRQSSTDPLTPSAQIQADAIGQIQRGRAPLPMPRGYEPVLFLCTEFLVLVAVVVCSPVAASLLTILLIGFIWSGSVWLSLAFDRLLDPLAPSLAGVAVFGVTSVASYASTRRSEARLRRRFEQHLAPAVVRRIVERPDLLKLDGERRELTALFTDIESFTAMTHNSDAVKLVSLLDDYVDGVSEIVISHGGMVDKIVGDAVHAFFNAPLDLENHPVCAFRCSLALRRWTEKFRSQPAALALGLRQTRIGLETGKAIVGDIGSMSKLDYTAHGDVVNAAARLEAANKELGSSICIGPIAASRLDPSTIRPIGKIALRGRDDLFLVYEPWPPSATPEARVSYLAAFALLDAEPDHAAALFNAMAPDCPADLVVARLANQWSPGKTGDAEDRCNDELSTSRNV
jgi:adenylate cyclase